MMLKHGMITKETRQDRGESRLSRWIGAAVLAAGLAFLPYVAAAQEKACTDSKILFISTNYGRDGLYYREGRCTLHEGNYILALFFAGDGGWQSDVKISKIDRRGIEISFDTEIFMSEHARASPVRINYGKTKTVGEAALTVSITAISRSGDGVVIEIVPHTPKPAKSK